MLCRFLIQPLWVCLLFLLQPVLLFAQKQSDYETLKKKYPDDNAVFILRKQNVEIKIEKGSPVIYNNVSEDLLLMSDKTSPYAERDIYWTDFSQISDLDARSIVPKGHKFKTIKVKNFVRSNDIADGTFFDDSKTFKFNYPGLVNNSQAILSYTEKINDPHLYGRFFFNTYAPAENVEYSITFPQGVKIKYKLFNMNDSALQFNTKKSGSQTTYTWKIKDAKKVKTEDGAPGLSYYVPNIIVLIESYDAGGQTREVLPDVAHLYDWYYNLMKNIDRTITPEVQRLVDSITAGSTAPLDKVRRIFSWVENNINYVAYEDSLAGVIPREASVVITRRFGDCKDMATTLTEMIHAAGLSAYPTWLGTRDISYSFSDVPSPITANHMICTYIQNGEYYFLDATGKEGPFGFPTSMIQGKQAIIGMGEDKYRLVTIPETDMSRNLIADTTQIELLPAQKGSNETGLTHVKGSEIAYATGYNKILIVERIRNADDKDRKDFISGLLQKGNNKFYIDSLSFQRMDEDTDDLIIKYRFGLDDYAESNGDELYVNMNLEKEYADDLIEKNREAPIAEEFKNIVRHIIIMKIPPQYKISFLPADCSFSNPDFGFTIHYSLHGDSVMEEQQVYMNTLMIEPAEFDLWNKMIRKLTKAYNETVTLRKS